MTSTTLTPSAAQNLIQGSERISTIDHSSVAANTAVVLVRRLITKRQILKALRGRAGTFGASSTYVVNVDGVAVPGLSIAIAASNTTVQKAPTSETIVEPGSLVDIECTVAGAGNANTTLQLIMAEVGSN